MNHRPGRALAAVLSVATAAAVTTTFGGVAAAATTPTPVVSPVAISELGDTLVGSTLAPNGDRHPYALAVVPNGYTGMPLARGDVLVVDRDNAAGVAGQGRTVLRFHGGVPSVFSTAEVGAVGLTFSAGGGALWLARYGTVDDGSHGAIVVERTTTVGAATAGAPVSGGVIGEGHGPWAIASNHSGSAAAYFWSTIDGRIVRDAKVASPYATSSATQNVHTVLATLSHTGTSIVTGTIVAPSGMAYDSSTGTLFVLDPASNQIVSIHNAASTGPVAAVTLVTSGGPLHTPRSLAIDPNTGHLLVTNATGDNRLVELTQAGALVGTRDLDPTSAPGSITGLVTTRDAAGQTQVYYLNAATNALHVLAVSPTAVTLAGVTSYTARYGTSVTISGTAPPGSAVGIWFHRAGVDGFVQRRTLQAGPLGTFSTSFAPNDDYQYYAQVGSKLSGVVTETLTPTISGALTKTAAVGKTIVLSGHGAAHGSVLLHFHKAGTSAQDYSLLRTVHVNADGVWTKSVVLSVDYRVYASRGALHPYSAKVLLDAR